MNNNLIRIGCAGWSVSFGQPEQFPSRGSHLQRYATRFNAVEINTSFYRFHQPATYARWAASVPDDFQFAVKAPREITHQLRLRDAHELWQQFIAGVNQLGSKLGVVLVQLPPSVQFDSSIVTSFFTMTRRTFAGLLALEVRHRSWLDEQVERVLKRFDIARVQADPPAAGEHAPGGWDGLAYFRLHGSPRVYYSAYDAAHLAALAHKVTEAQISAHSVWCIFDNTAEGASLQNALDLQRILRATRVSASSS